MGHSTSSHRWPEMFLAMVMLASSACGGTSMVLKSPVEDKCTESGLRGCPELTDGVLLYVDGDKEKAKTKIRAGVAANTPARVREFATTLKTLVSLPGVSSYSGPILEIATLLASEAGTAPARDFAPIEERSVSKGSEPRASDRRASTAEGEAAATKTTTVIVRASAKMVYCRPFAGIAPEATVGESVCAPIAMGPLVITDLHAGPGCANEVFVLAGTAHEPRWFVVSPASAPLAIHGARFELQDGEALIAGQRAPAADLLKKDGSCGITWSGVKP